MPGKAQRALPGCGGSCGTSPGTAEPGVTPRAAHALASDWGALRVLRNGPSAPPSRFWLRRPERSVYERPRGQHGLSVGKKVSEGGRDGAVAHCMHHFIFDLTASAALGSHPLVLSITKTIC